MNYKKIKEGVEKKVLRAGKPITLLKPGSSQYDPVTGKKIEAPGTEFPGSALELQFDAKSIEGTEIRISDLLLLCVEIPEPAAGDILIVEKKERKVLTPVKRLCPAETVIYYEVFVR